MSKTIKAWAIVDKRGDYLSKEALPNWGRFWIFETRKQARKEMKSRFYNTHRSNIDKVVRIKIIRQK
ncbi:hypothetical protein LCGC14_2734940 [marine sediment metagenome]|uniref:Uncharacterized protein n=1 Tax=marine sediment metagenome TaxID=412755 RepID=A0A0F9BXR8_9ZZZZ